jgi:hypothetical protein
MARGKSYQLEPGSGGEAMVAALAHSVSDESTSVSLEVSQTIYQQTMSSVIEAWLTRIDANCVARRIHGAMLC